MIFKLSCACRCPYLASFFFLLILFPLAMFECYLMFTKKLNVSTPAFFLIPPPSPLSMYLFYLYIYLFGRGSYTDVRFPRKRDMKCSFCISSKVSQKDIHAPYLRMYCTVMVSISLFFFFCLIVLFFSSQKQTCSYHLVSLPGGLLQLLTSGGKKI